MPSQFDNTYHYYYAQPHYDTEEDQRFYETKREFETIFEEAVPPLPTREMELEYLDFLQNSFKNDPWVTYRFRKYMAGPKRIPWSNYREQSSVYRTKFWATVGIVGFAFYPVACVIGRYQKTTIGGVPAYPIARYVHDFPKIQPHRASWLVFRKWSLLSSFLVGYVSASYLVDSTPVKNGWFNRPDYKPYPAMVKKEGLVKEQEEYWMEQAYPWRYSYDWKRSAVYRFFFPESADWTIKSNPYTKLRAEEVVCVSDGYYRSFTNDFTDHLPH